MSKQKKDIDLLKHLQGYTKCRANFGIGRKRDGSKTLIVPRDHELSEAEIDSVSTVVAAFCYDFVRL